MEFTLGSPPRVLLRLPLLSRPSLRTRAATSAAAPLSTVHSLKRPSLLPSPHRLRGTPSSSSFNSIIAAC